MAGVSLLGNIAVFLGRFFMREDDQVHSFLIRNLALADLCMGSYLVIIACHDVRYRGIYLLKDYQWRHGVTCGVSGVLSSVSSVMSVAIISIITLDRYISITYPMTATKHNFRKPRVAAVVMLTLWTLALLFSVFPLVPLSYFSGGFYSHNGVCLPLFINKPRLPGWEYSACLFLGTNMAAACFVFVAYVKMFGTIRHSRSSVRCSRHLFETALVLRFFCIVLTNFLCWLPILTCKILALSGKLMLFVSMEVRS